ncbi:MAG: phosphotransferase [Dehalococcoidia bacterium]
MVDVTELKRNVENWISKQMPQAEAVSITEPEKPGMGLSSETWLFDIHYRESGEQRRLPAVLRSAPREGGVFPEYELGNQFRIMQILGTRTDIPVARMLWLEEDPAVIGVPFFLMERLDGDVPQDYPSYHGSGVYYESTPEQRKKMWWGTLENMAKIHQLDWKGLGITFLGEPENPADALDRQLIYWERYFEWLKDDLDNEHPTMASTLKWLRENKYEPERMCLCWGDARIGNTLYSLPDREVLAIMDWEMAFIGDPMADLTWSFTLDKQHSEGYGLAKLEGTPLPDEIVSRYEELTGWRAENLLYNEVLSTLRYGGTVIAVMKKLIKQGIPMDADMIRNNFATQHLSDLLDLPSPGPKLYEKQTSDVSEITATVQFHFTGPGGSEWYLACDKGKGSRHEGEAENPDCIITVSVEDWKAIQSGELNRLEAWSSGRLVTDGDLGLLALLEDMMREFT